MTIFELPPGPVAPPLWAWGNPAILNLPRAAVLSSRTSRNTAPSDRWVAAVKHLAGTAIREGQALVASLNTRPYELVCRLAFEAAVPLIVVSDGVLPDLGNPETCATFKNDYEGLIDFSRTLLVSAHPPGGRGRGDAGQRDEIVAALADRLLCSEIRSGGHMERLGLQALARGKQVQVFKPSHFDAAVKGNLALLEAGAEAVALPGEAERPRNKAASLGEIRIDPALLKDHLIHFTRACSGPWPGQSPGEYYSGLIHDRPDAAHTALDTLKRILTEGRIRGGNRLTRGGSKAVSFVDGRVPDWSALFRWRKGLARWTMEPYGVAIPREDLTALGARPVIYGGEEVWKQLPEGERHRFQIHRPPEADWRVEREWRLAGDFLVGAASHEKIEVVVRTNAEAEAVEAEIGLKSIALMEG